VVRNSKPFVFIYILFVLFSSALLFSSQLMAAEESGCSISLEHSDANKVEISVDLLNLDIKPDNQGEGYVIRIPGESIGGSPGGFDLPHISRMIVIPPSAGIELDWSASEVRTLSSKTPSIVTDKSQSEEHQWVGPTLMRQTGLLPENVVEIGDPVIMRGIRMVNVTVNPVQYNPVSGDLLVYDKIDVKLNFTDNNVVNPVANPGRIRPSEAVLSVARSMVLNTDALERDDPEMKGSYVFVIPEFDGLRDVIAPLIEWRTRQGYPTQVIEINRWVGNNELRNMLIDAYFDWEIPPEYVTIIGEADRRRVDFSIPTFDVGRAFMWETDYTYSLLDGNDMLPDVAIGRLSARNLDDLGVIVNKIISYETNPHLVDDDGNDDSAWLRRSALLANDQRTGYSAIFLNRWLRKMLLDTGFEEVDTLYFTSNPNQQDCHDFIERNITDGISMFNYRGWGQFNGAWAYEDAGRLNNVGKWPFLVLPTCNTGDFADHVLNEFGYTESFVWVEGGGIGALGSSGFTHTNYNNVLCGGIQNGLFRDNNWHFGWALNQGKMELYRHFGMFNDVQDPQVETLLVWEAHAYQFNLMGDPATQIWTAIPTALNVTYQPEISLGDNRITVLVADENDNPLSDINVSLVHDLEVVRLSSTSAEGLVEFTFNPGELELGTYLITAFQHDKVPHIGEIEVEEVDYCFSFGSLVIDDDGEDASQGNDNEIANPGERLELRTYVKNFGNQAVEGVVGLNLSLLSGFAEIIDGDARIEEAPALEDSVMVTFVVDVGTLNRNGGKVVLALAAETGDLAWNSAIEFNVAAADLEAVDFVFEPDPFTPGDTAWVDVSLRNFGPLASDELHATLVSNRDVIVVFNNEADYEASQPDGDNVTARFRIYSHTLTVPGTTVDMTIHLEAENGFQDEATFNFVVGQAGHGTPFGPDYYGYVCFDDTDAEWPEVAPEYEWIEIDPEQGGPGTDTEIADLGNEQDFSVPIDLPFQFQYYGRTYGPDEEIEDRRKITICSNGWFAFGDESKLADFQNRRIPPALGPWAQVCVFWDDLVNYVDRDQNRIGGIYYWYDEENHRFIIEWSQMRRYIGMIDGRIRPGSVNTFQAIVYDPQHYPTYTGDGEIAFQYQTSNDDRDVDPLEYDTPYATVGLVNLNGTNGMEYVFWNEYANGAAVLQDERAIKFSTKLVIVTGSIHGTVVEYDTGEPIPGAEIRGSRGSFGLTNRDGEYVMDNVLVGEDYSFTAWAPGYNDSTRSGFDIVEDGEINLDFSLRHPNFALSDNSLSALIQPDTEQERVITVTNDGNGVLSYRTFFDYSGEDQAQRWRKLAHISVTDSVGDGKIQGVTFRDNDLWITGSNNRSNPNKFYLFDRDGVQSGVVDQPGVSSYGFRGMTLVDDVIYGGDTDWIVAVDLMGNAIDSIPGPLDLQRALAYDPAGTFFVANGRTDPLVQIDLDGNVLNTYEHELDIWGLGYFRDDSDGLPLYIVSRDKTNPALRIPFALVTKMNPETGEMRVVTVLEGELEDQVGGMAIVKGFDPMKWVMAVVMTNASGDKVSIYDLGPNTDWINFAPRFADVDPGETLPITFMYNSTGLDVGSYELLLNFQHNAENLEQEMIISLEVSAEASANNETNLPLEFGLAQNYPNPFNATTAIPFALTKASDIKLAVFDIVGRQVAELATGQFQAGRHTLTLNAADYSSGVYIVRLEAGNQVSRMKMALIK